MRIYNKNWERNKQHKFYKSMNSIIKKIRDIQSEDDFSQLWPHDREMLLKIVDCAESFNSN